MPGAFGGGGGGTQTTKVEIPEFQKNRLEQLFNQIESGLLRPTNAEQVTTTTQPQAASVFSDFQQPKIHPKTGQPLTQTQPQTTTSFQVPEGEEPEFLQPEFFPGDTVANLTPDQQAAFQAGRTAAGNISNTVLPQIRDASQFGLNFVRDIPSNPVVQAAIEGAVNPIQERLQRDVLPGIDSGAVQAGQVGSSRQGVIQANALQDFNRAALDTSAGIQNQALRSGLDTFASTLALQPELANVERTPARILDAIGQRQQGQQQAEINAEIAKHNFNDPFNQQVSRLAQLRDLLVGNFGGNTTAPTGGNTTSPLAGAASGALTGFGATGTPVGALIGGGLGFAGSLL